MALSKKESDSELIQIMLDYQDKLNTELKGEDWRSQNLQWHRAIWIECRADGLFSVEVVG